MKKDFYEKHQYAVNFWVFVTLIITMGVMIWQSCETRRSVDISEKNLKIQSASYITFENVYTYCTKDSIKIIKTCRKTGSGPIISYNSLKDIIFWVSSSDLKTYYQDPKKNEAKIFFFKKVLLKKILDFLVSQDDITDTKLRTFLEYLKKNPILYSDVRNNISNMKINIDNYNVFDDTTEWSFGPSLPEYLPSPNSDLFPVGSGRSVASDILKEIKDDKEILLNYYIIKYDCIVVENMKTYYMGFLDGGSAEVQKIKDSSSGVEIDVYPLITYKSWLKPNI